jgi:hypothetical protein
MNKKNISKNIFGLKPLTTGHAGRFRSGWGWFSPFQPPVEAYMKKQQRKPAPKFSTSESLPPLQLTANG